LAHALVFVAKRRFDDALKSDRDRAKAALERIKAQLAPGITLGPDQVQRFGAGTLNDQREHVPQGLFAFDRRRHLVS